MQIKSSLDRPDSSKNELYNFKNQGYDTVVFEANLQADPQCKQFDGFIYVIDELLKLDNPIFRISHPNCNCKFTPYGKQSEVNNQNNTEIEPTREEVRTETPILNQQIPLSERI